MLEIQAFTALKFAHLMAIVIGMGCAIALDVYLAKLVIRRRRLTATVIDLVNLFSLMVVVGLVLLFATGIALMVMREMGGAHMLENQKFVGKLWLVSVMLCNAVYVHFSVLPHVRAGAGRRLFEGLSLKRSLAFMLSGSISFSCWSMILILAPARELNGKAVLVDIVSLFAIVVTVAFVALVALFAPSLRQAGAVLEDEAKLEPQF